MFLGLFPRLPRAPRAARCCSNWSSKRAKRCKAADKYAVDDLMSSVCFIPNHHVFEKRLHVSISEFIYTIMEEVHHHGRAAFVDHRPKHWAELWHWDCLRRPGQTQKQQVQEIGKDWYLGFSSRDLNRFKIIHQNPKNFKHFGNLDQLTTFVSFKAVNPTNQPGRFTTGPQKLRL